MKTKTNISNDYSSKAHNLSAEPNKTSLRTRPEVKKPVAVTVEPHFFTPLTALLLVVALFNVASIASTKPSQVGGKPDITVMTRNLYIGALLDPVVGATDPAQVPILVAQTVGKIVATDFPARSAALAQEIVDQQPDVVGLQEVTLLRMQSPGDFVVGNPVSATNTVLDYLEILQLQLAARGASYAVAAIVTNWDIELPMAVATDAGFRLDDVRATDFDVMLVRTDLPPGQLRVVNSAAGNYVTAFQISVAGVTLSFPRGWCLVDLQSRGRSIRVINTHLESVSPLLRAAQAVELVSGPAGIDGEIICLGDFNSDPAFPAPEAYAVMAAGGFSDAWAIAHPNDSGYTWGQADDLLNPVSTVSERDDFVWFRGTRLSVEAVALVGHDASNRVPSLVNPQNLLWPSDHAGVVARLRLR
jgi:endonuclease/exonuclease/phosphatase family metal-dependent hydrolase